MPIFFFRVLIELRTSTNYGDSSWVIAKPDLIPNSKVLTITFSRSFLLTYFAVSCIWWMFSKVAGGFDELQDSFFNMFALTIGAIVPVMPKLSFLKILMHIYILYSMNMITCFQAHLSSILTNPPLEDTINNVEELANSDRPILLYGFDVEFIKGANATAAKKLYDRHISAALTEEDRTQKILKEHCASIGNKIYSQRDNYRNRLKFLGSDFLRQFEFTFVFKKNNPYYEPINALINILVEHALPHVPMNKFISRIGERETKSENITLSLLHFEGAFILFMIGIVLSTLIFLIEIIIFKRKKVLNWN